MSDNNEASGFSPPAIDDLNQWLSGYEVVDLIACGGMGAVYRARQISLDRLVAIKILPPELAVNETFRKCFEAEGKAMAKLTHSNLVGVYDFGEISDMLFLVIEFVEGSNLFDSKADAVIDPEVAVTLIRSVSAGLAEAHHNGIIHRDIKPANILINHDLVPKLGDFGLAVPDSDIESGLMMGTPAYLAPEVMADPTSASFASDIYALGVILYEMLTGDLIEGGDKMDLSRVPVRGDLQKIVRKAVDPKPLLRYQSGEEFEKALGEWLRKPKTSGLTMAGGGPTIRPNVTPTVTATSTGNGGLFLGLAALLVVGGLAWFLMGGDSKSGDESDDKTTATLPTVVEDIPTSKPEVTVMEKEATIETLRPEQLKLLQEMSQRLAGELSQNRREFLQEAGEEGEEFLKVAPNETPSLPRHLLVGEAEISTELLGHLQEYATSRQARIDRKYRQEISSLHRNSIRNLKGSEIDFPADIDGSWQKWAEWLGRDPLEIMHTSLAGQWRYTSATDGFDLRISSTGKAVLFFGENQGKPIIGTGAEGEILLNHSGRTELYFPWKLRWRGDRLEGTDTRGAEKLLKRIDFDFSGLSTAPESGESSGDEMVTKTPDEDEPKMVMFDDPELAKLTANYRKALMEKIEPLEAGYLRILNQSLNVHKSQSNETVVEQIEEEKRWVANLKWREGFTQLVTMTAPGDLPSKLVDPQTVFRREFGRRFEPVQRTYLRSLETMLRARKFKGRKDVGEIEAAIKKVASPEGAVLARFVKIESLPDEGLENATIAEIEIVDFNGKDLPIGKFTDARTSSHHVRENGELSDGKCAFDGDRDTIWHNKWRGSGSEFPHWLSFDLGQEAWIKGFRITPRKDNTSRSTDVTNWNFYTSLNGRIWTLVAAGKFPKGNQKNEHLGLEEIE